MINKENLFVPYKCNGNQTVFPIGLEYLSAPGNIKIIKTDILSGTDETLILDTDYTVNIRKDVFTTTEAYSKEYRLTVFSSAAYTQETDIVSASSYDPENLESASDKNAILMKQLKEEFSRTMKLRESESGVEMILPSKEAMADGYFGFNQDGFIISHPEINPENYVAVKEYTAGDLVQSGGKIFSSKVSSNTGNAPLFVSGDAFWTMKNLEGSSYSVDQLYETDEITQGGGSLSRLDADGDWHRVIEKGDPGDFNTWDAGTTYLIDEVIKTSEDYFICISESTGDIPADSPSSWKRWPTMDAIKDILNIYPSNQWDAGTKIVATDPEAGDIFGISVAISGDYAIVGANLEDAGGSNAGAAYIYHRTGLNTWSGTKIVATNPEAYDQFGISVAISGDYAIVGAPGEDAGGSAAGAAYIYVETFKSLVKDL